MSRREKKEHTSRKDWDNKSMKIQKEKRQLPMGGLCKAGVKYKQIEMKMVEENVIAIRKIIIMVRKKRPLACENTVLFDWLKIYP